MNTEHRMCVRHAYLWGIFFLCMCSSPGLVKCKIAQLTTSPNALTPDYQGETASNASEVRSNLPRRADYLLAKEKAYHWLNQLQVNPVELVNKGYKGKKILAEILDAYIAAHRYTTDQSKRAQYDKRIALLAQHTHQPAYHNMQTNSDKEFRHNAMSYLRVCWLLNYMKLDTADYQTQIQAIQPRLDETLPDLGPWMQAVYGTYYETFGLIPPPTLPKSPLKQGLIATQLPLANYTRLLMYHLSHEVYARFDYGYRHNPNAFSPTELAYLHDIIPQLMEQAITEYNADLLAEFFSCMTYLGWQDHPINNQAISYLLDHQNSNGTWGSNYESRRKRYGQYLDHNLYLHTTLVTIRALIEVYEGFTHAS